MDETPSAESIPPDAAVDADDDVPSGEKSDVSLAPSISDRSDEDDFTLTKKLDLRNDKTNRYYETDERRYQVRKHWLKSEKEGGQSMADEAAARKGLVEKCVEKSDERLKELDRYGRELITNINVVSQKRELLRRDFETKHRVDMQRVIQTANIEASAQFDNIMAKFTELMAYDEPLECFEELSKIKQEVEKEMLRKNNLIKTCQDEVDRVCLQYDQMIMQQEADIKAFTVRASTQVELTQAAHEHHLEMLVATMAEARESIFQTEQAKFNDFHDTYQKYEHGKLDEIQKRRAYYRDKMERIARMETENFRSTSRRLQEEHDNLLLEMRNTKTNFMVNSEKIDYHFLIQPKREEENFAIWNEQKRRIARLREAIVRSKSELKRTQEINRQLIKKRAEKAQKLHDSITDVEKKRRRLQLINKKKFYDLWKINFYEVKTTILDVSEVDRVITETILLMPYEEPQVDFYEYRPDDLAKEAKATLGPPTISNSVQIASSKKVSKANTFKTKPQLTEPEKRANIRLMRNLLRLLADQGGFLIETRIKHLITPYTDQAKNLVKLANILDALRLRDMDCLKNFMKYFERYAWCPNCLAGKPPQSLQEVVCPKAEVSSNINSARESKISNSIYSSSWKASPFLAKSSRPLTIRDSAINFPGDCEQGNEQQDAKVRFSLAPNTERTPSSATLRTSDNFIKYKKASTLKRNIENKDEESRIQETFLPQYQERKLSFRKPEQLCSDHYLVIDPSFVYAGLLDYIEDQKLESEQLIVQNALQAKDDPINLIRISNDEIQAYWSSFKDYVPKHKLRLWCLLDISMTRLHEDLKRRAKLDRECAALRKQNKELEYFLQKHMETK